MSPCYRRIAPLPPAFLLCPPSLAPKLPPLLPKWKQEGADKGGFSLLHLCHICGKQFRRRYNLAIHKKIHSNERPFSCTVCGKSFRRQDHLRDHIYTHGKVKPHVCVKCGKGFCQAKNLKLHIVICTEENRKL